MSRPVNRWQMQRMENASKRNSGTAYFDLPEEVRRMVYGFLDQTTTLSLRIISRQFNQDIERNVQFDVRFHQVVPVIPWLMSLRIRDCKIIVPSDHSKSHLIQNIVLAHPLTLRRFLVIHPSFYNENSRLPVPSVCPEIYTQILPSCARQIRELSVTLDAGVLAHQIMLGERFQFLNLSVLNVTVRVPTRISIQGGEDIFQELVGQSVTPKLVCIQIKLEMYPSDKRQELLRAVLRCLTKSRSLATFHLQLPRLTLESYLQNIQTDSILSAEEMVKFNRNDKLENLKLEYVSLYDENCCWRKLVVNQQKLHSVHLKTLQNIPYEIIQTLVAQNYCTLVSVFAGFVKGVTIENGIEKPLDFSLFQRCIQLTSLTLASSCLDVLTNAEANLINFHMLPPRLEQLSLAYFEVQTEELFRIGEATDTLQSLTIEYGGSRGVLGVTGSVIHHMMSIGNLMHLKFTELNVSLEAENEIVNSIVEEFGFATMPFNINQKIQLFRNPTTMAWHNSN